MNRINGCPGIVFVLIVVLCGCQAKTYDHSAQCTDRDVTYCEDFETVSIQFNAISATGSEWIVTNDHWLSNWSEGLPSDGRSPESFGSVGFESHYHGNSESLFVIPSIDLSSASAASLRFNLLFLTEPQWDGMILIATPDQGESWVYLEPLGEYPSTVKVGSSIVPGYSGLQPYWSHEELDLNQFLGKEVSVGFLFMADDSINNIGVAVDDIVLQTKSKGFIAQSNYNFEFPDLSQLIPRDPLISKEIPKTIAIVDAPCEGEEDEILRNSQIAYTKAINSSRERYLILHPDSGNYCWVRVEDVWIDGEEGDLPELSDLRREDKYLPFCSLHQTPIFDDPACLNLTTAEGVEPSYHLSQVLIENGVMTTMLIDPGQLPEQELTEYDPRVGVSEDFPAYDKRRMVEGNLLITINDQQVGCSIDSVLPGRVVCDDLNLDSAEPYRLVYCWTGWDEFQSCPPGYGSLTDEEGCYLLVDNNNCFVECPLGYKYSEGSQVCLIDRDPAILRTSYESCPEGYKENTEADCCLTPSVEDHFICPDGFVYLDQKGACQRKMEEAECAEGFILDQDSGVCSSEVEIPLPICSGFDIEFPQTLIILKNATTCRKGPGRDDELVSSLSPFSEVEVLGIDAGKEFLIINNPKYQIPCWAELNDFYADKLNIGILPVISLTSTVD
jgi:hypothetical protein